MTKPNFNIEWIKKKAPSAEEAEGALNMCFRVGLEVEPDSESEDSRIENSEGIVELG